MAKNKRTYPLTAAGAMGASGMRCPQIIEDPTDRRIPYMIEVAEGYYILHYSEESLPRSYVVEGIYGSSDPEVISAMGFADFLKGESGGKDLVIPMRRARVAFDGVVSQSQAKREAEYNLMTTVTVTNNPGYRDDWVYAFYEDEARKRIADAFQIPEEHLRREGRKFIYDKKAPQKPEERVYDASAWTGRKSRKPSPDLTPAEAWANLEATIHKEIEGLFDWFRSWTVREYYFDDERILRSKTALVLALQRKDRDIIRRHIELRNGVRKVDNAFREIGRAVRSATRQFIRRNRQLKKD